MVGQGTSEDIVVVADSCHELVDAPSRLLCVKGEDATRLEIAMTDTNVRVQCILSCERLVRENKETVDFKICRAKRGSSRVYKQNVEGFKSSGRARRM